MADLVHNCDTIDLCSYQLNCILSGLLHLYMTTLSYFTSDLSQAQNYRFANVLAHFCVSFDVGNFLNVTVGVLFGYLLCFSLVFSLVSTDRGSY
jgi:hypothetical protein